MAIGVRQQQRRGTAAEWSTANPVLAAGEFGLATDTGIIKFGNGASAWNDLPIAFSEYFLPKLGTAADSELLDGMSSDSFVKVVNTTTAATADKVALRDGGGRLKAATAVSTDDVVNFTQWSNGRKIGLVRAVTAATTFAATDAHNIVMVTNGVRNATMAVTIPLNATVPIDPGVWIDIYSAGVGPVVATPAGGVTLRGDGRCYGNYGVIRLQKVTTDTWIVTERIDPIDAYARAHLYMDTNSPALSAFWRHCPLNNELFDSHNGHTTGTITGDDTDSTAPKQTNRYTCQPGQAGTYRVSGMINATLPSAAGIHARILKNGAFFMGCAGMSAAANLTAQSLTGTKDIVLAEGDYIGLQGFGGVANWIYAVNEDAAGGATSWMSVERIA